MAVVAEEVQQYSWEHLVQMQKSVADLSGMVVHLNLVLRYQLGTNHPSYATILEKFLELTCVMNNNLILVQGELSETIFKVLKETKGGEV